jgi:cysteine desulfurase
MRDAAPVWANPSSVHAPGREARALVERARDAVAGLVGFNSAGVVLTGGATEANNIALAAPYEDPLTEPAALVVSRVEHPSVRRCAEMLGRRGVVVVWADPEPSGVVSGASVADAVGRASQFAPVRLVSVQAANHETGTIHPIPELAELAHSVGALLHVDAVQAVGRLPPSLWAPADVMTVSAHKIRGPKGIGALAARPWVQLRPIIGGGGQEGGSRPGTQDPAACLGFAVAADIARGGAARYAAIAPLRDRLEASVIAAGINAGMLAVRNGDGPRGPHVFNASWPGWRGIDLCAALDAVGVCVSSGSACAKGFEPSPVITAIAGTDRATGAVRVSLGEETTLADVDEAARRWALALQAAR